VAWVKTQVVTEGIVTEVLVEEPDPIPVWGPDTKLDIVGQRIPKVDARYRVTGAGEYTFDKQLPGMLWVKAVRSPYPHARITGIDTSAALKLPGVVDVIHYQNTSAIPFSPNGHVFNQELSYAGDIVAAVAAEDPRILPDAIRAVNVTYEQLPFVTDIQQAIAMDPATGKQIFPQGVLAKPSIKDRGDINAGFAAADVTVEATYLTQVVHHTTMEPHGCVAQWIDGYELHVWDSTQSAYGIQQGLARTFQIPDSQIFVWMDFMGGGFGSKTGLWRYHVIASLLSKRTGRPVRYINDRREEILDSPHRPMHQQTWRLGATKDGKLTAVEMKSYDVAGAFNGMFTDISAVAHQLYSCPNVHTEDTTVFLNLHQLSAMRGPANTEAMVGMEATMDLLAAKLNMDPIQLRKLNYTNVDQTSGNPYSTKGLMDAYDAVSQSIGWQSKRRTTPGSDPGPKKRGVGVGSQIWAAAGGPPSNAEVAIQADGSVNIRSSVADLGEGPKTILSMVAAEELGVPLEVVNADFGHSDYPWDLGTFGSRVTPSMSPAVRQAAYHAKQTIFTLAASALGVDASQLDCKKGVVFVTSDPSKSIPFAKVAAMSSHTIIGNGWRGPNNPKYTTESFGAQAAEVEVDTETGVVTLLNMAAAHDCGRAINPMLVESQIHGGVDMAVGYGRFEEQVVDQRTGIPVTTNLFDYKVETAVDEPVIDAHIIENVDTIANDVGVKGMAEPPTMPTAPAIMNAVYNATGVWVRDMPLSPERVLRALKAAQQSKQSA
jgi:CO/xanthine dehydrogenase Mo-binding subunit